MRDEREGSIRLSRLSTLITIGMNVLVIIAVLLTVRLVVRYFGVLSGSAPGELLVAASRVFVLPLALTDVRSLYGGVFDLSASVTVMIVLLAEWLLSALRARV